MSTEGGPDWSDKEIGAVVRSYFGMLRMELLGESYNKSAERRALRRIVSRSDGSVEYKHQNISAALMSLGRLPIRGYKPAVNYQRALFDAVETEVEASRDLDGLMERAIQTPIAPSSLGAIDVVDAPEVVIDIGRWKPRSNGVLRDYTLRSEKNTALGAAGELAIVGFEFDRLSALGLPDLAQQIEHVALTRGDGLGFDVRSFNQDGSERLIEVKTTIYSAAAPFFVSRTELEKSRERQESYYLYRLFDFGKKRRLYELSGALDSNCTLEPSEYVAGPRLRA